jgi:type III restriction enzyme
VEYKGAFIADNQDSREKDLIGRLWATRSNGQCRFVMVSNRDWEAIRRAVM